MSSLNTYVVTFNCGRKAIDIDFFAAHLFAGLKSRDVPPDLVVLCLQEVAPIAYSFLSASMMAHYTRRLEAAVMSGLRNDFGADTAEDFRPVQSRNVGMIAIMLFAKKDILARLKRVDTAETGVGLWEMGNKGAVGLRLWIAEEHGDEAIPFTFVSAHLAPMESAWKRRNEDWRSICQRLVFTSDAQLSRSRTSEDEPLLASNSDDDRSAQSMFTPLSPLVFAGDLNYRTSNLKPESEDYKDWPAPPGKTPDDFDSMLKLDQLTRERTAKHTMHLMDEAEIHFPPSYKYSSNALNQAMGISKGSEPNSMSLWAEHRIPSWCDRILYLAAAQAEVHSYDTLPIQPTSDHRPVVLSLSLSMKQLAPDTIEPPFSIDQNWKSKRIAARRLELLVGIAAYLVLTNEGRAVLAGSVVGIVGVILTTQFLVS